MNKRNTPFLLLFSMFVLLSAGCKTLYNSAPTNMPLLSQDGEVQASGSIGSNGYNLQAVWAPVEHFALMANGASYSENTDSLFLLKYRHSYGEVGLGGWTRLDKFLRLEAFAGMGWGITGEFPRRDLYRKFFFQPNFGWSGRFVDAGVSPKLSVVSHKEVKGVADPTFVRSTSAFWEPTVMARLGWQEVKFQVTGSYIVPLGSSNFTYQKWTIGLGFHLTLGKDFERYDFTID